MNRPYTVLLRWLPFAALSTIAAGLVYVTVTQGIRLSADDPQVGLAEDAVMLLESGQPPQIFGSDATIDMSRSLTPFIIVYDWTGKPLNGTGMIDGVSPTPPPGVFEHASEEGENRITWEPVNGTRIAAVVMPYRGEKPGYVLAGRSLREVEKRTNVIMYLVFVGWAAALVSSFAFVALQPDADEEAHA